MQVKCKELTTLSTIRKSIHCKVEGFGKLLWKLSLDSINQKIKLWKKSDNKPHSNFIEGLIQIILILDIFLDMILQESKSDNFYIKVYNAVYLKNSQILRIIGEFQSKKWFSNIGPEIYIKRSGLSLRIIN